MGVAEGTALVGLLVGVAVESSGVAVGDGSKVGAGLGSTTNPGSCGIQGASGGGADDGGTASYTGGRLVSAKRNTRKKGSHRLTFSACFLNLSTTDLRFSVRDTVTGTGAHSRLSLNIPTDVPSGSVAGEFGLK